MGRAAKNGRKIKLRSVKDAIKKKWKFVPYPLWNMVIGEDSIRFSFIRSLETGPYGPFAIKFPYIGSYEVEGHLDSGIYFSREQDATLFILKYGTSSWRDK